jgi:hypothetical protein
MAHLTRQLIRAAISLLAINIIHGHSSFMTQNSYCNLPLTVGTTIIRAPTVISFSRTLIVSRGTTVLTSGASYVAGESLTVSLTSTSNEYIFETSGATFNGGGCSNKRYADGEATMVMPTIGSGLVSRCWELGEVSISPSFILTDPVISSSDPSTIPPRVNAISSQPKQLSPTDAIVTNVFIAVAAVLFILASLVSYVTLFKNGYIPQTSPIQQSRFVFIIAVCCAIAATVLVSLWAQDNNTSSQSGYLGLPSFNANPIAWHIVLMVGGFFFGQTLATSSWKIDYYFP